MTQHFDLALKVEADAHDVASSSSPTGKECARRSFLRRVLNITVEADAAAGTTIAARPELGFPASEYPNGVDVKEIKLRSVAIAPHADNHGTDTFGGLDVNGANGTTVATLTSDADVAVGSGGLGAAATTASKEYAALLNATPANRVIPAGGCLTLTRAKGGTGVQFGKITYTVVVEIL